MVVVVVLGEMVVVTVSGAGVVGLTVTSARARTIGRAKAEMTMPVVTKYASSLQGLLAASSLCLLANMLGMGQRR